MTFKIEAGKYYRNRKGDVVGPVNVDYGDYYIVDNHYWTDGRKFLNKNNPNDLIEEVPNPNEQPMPSDYHLQLAIDLTGLGRSVKQIKGYPSGYSLTINVARYIAQYKSEPEPVDPVLLEARRRVEKYLGYSDGRTGTGNFDDSAFMNLVLDALRFDASTLK